MPNERNNNQQPRAGFLQRGRASFDAFRQRQLAELRASNPFSQDFQWQQGLDALTSLLGVPGNHWDAQTRQPTGPVVGAARGIRNLFSGRERPGYTPGAGMGIMPNPQGWMPPQAQGDTINIQPNLPGTLPQGEGALMSHQAPAPRGGRPDLNTFMLMREAPGAAAERAYLNMLWAERRRER